MRLAVRNVAFPRTARNFVAVLVALSGLPIVVLTSMHGVSIIVTMIVACAVAAAIGFAPTSGGYGHENGNVETDGETLRLDVGARRHVWAVRDIAGAWTESDGKRVVLNDRAGRTLSFDVDSAADAEALLAEATLGPGARVTRMPVGGASSRSGAAGLAFGCLLSTAVGLVSLIGAAYFAAADSGKDVAVTLGTTMAIVAMAAFATAIACFNRVRVKEITVGRDGVLIPRGLFAERRVPLESVTDLRVEDDKITLHADMRAIPLRTSNRDQARAVGDAIGEVVRRYVPSAIADRSVLERGDRSATDWTTHLREVAVAARTYRSGFEIADLLAVAEDPSTNVEHRVAATLILARVADDYRPRLRIAAEGTVDSNLRAAMLRAIEEGSVDDDAVRRAAAFRS